MDYFAGLDISMDETHVCVLDREGWWFARARRRRQQRDSWRIGESANLSSHCVRNRTHGADPFSRVGSAWFPGGLRRELTGLPGARVTGDPQERSQRGARAGAFGPCWVLQARARAPARFAADRRAQEAGRRASDPGKSDPWSRGRDRGPTVTRADRRLHRIFMKHLGARAGRSRSFESNPASDFHPCRRRQ